jgi:mannose-6-phosphate isomerase-like protein (cupin superfamily)
MKPHLQSTKPRLDYLDMTTVLSAAQAPRFEIPGVTFVGLASPSRGTEQLCTWKIVVAPGHESDAPHTLDRDEVFMVLSGTVCLSEGGEHLGPGDATVVPAGEKIQLSNPGAEPAEVIVAIPAGFSAKMADGTSFGTPPWAA